MMDLTPDKNISEHHKRIERELRVLTAAVNQEPSAQYLLAHFARYSDYVFLLRETLEGLPGNMILRALRNLFTVMQYLPDGPLRSSINKVYDVHSLFMRAETEFLRAYGRKATRSALIEEITNLSGGALFRLSAASSRDYLFSVHQHPDVLGLIKELEALLLPTPELSGACQ